jgi:kumamolisin
MPQTHAAIVGSERTPLPGAKATGRADARTTVKISLKLRRKQPLVVTGRPRTVLTRDQFANTYGAAQRDIDRVVETFSKAGLHHIETNPTTRTIRFHGPVSVLEEAFQVTLFNYKHESGNYRGRVGPVYVPHDMKDIVQGVFGLDDRRIAQRRRRPTSGSSLGASSPVPRSWYVPSKLASHYNFPLGDGCGQTIGLLEFGGGYFKRDLKIFCAKANVPTLAVVTPISTDHTPTNRKDVDASEVMLDIETVAGLCPGAKIAVYFAHWSDQGWITGLDYAIHDREHNPRVLSISYGAAEDIHFWTPQARSQINETLQDAAMLGITVCVATGDDGSTGAVLDGYAHVSFPASSPYVLSVGGTTILNKRGRKRDVVWKKGDGIRQEIGGTGGSTGGGVSAIFPQPNWQKGLPIASVNPGALGGRCVPDIAANADWKTSPYLLVLGGKLYANGGTSAASPLVAALLTIINAGRPANSPVGYVTPVLYQTDKTGKGTRGKAGCTDVTSGNNISAAIGGYQAGRGYDAASGWGTPDGKKLARALPVP